MRFPPTRPDALHPAHSYPAFLQGIVFAALPWNGADRSQEDKE